VQENALKEIKSLLDGKNILEIGCGSGYWFPYLREWGAKEVYGIDISNPMLRLAQTEKVAQASATNLPFRNETFDVVITVTTLQHLESVDEVRCSLKEMRRMLKGNGGCAILLELSQPQRVSLFAPLLAISKDEWEHLFQQNGLVLGTSLPVDPSASMFVIDLLTYKMIKLIMKIQGEKGEGSRQILSPHSKLVRLYYLLKDALCIPSILGLRMAKKFYPKLSNHWIYILQRGEP
jgi:ubiquinone/menaquinone biosynthesis C-methylase UbiE